MNAEILENTNIRGDYYRIRFRAPLIAAGARPGHFVHVRIDERRDHILRRPFSIHNAADGRVSLIYKVVGAGTATHFSYSKTKHIQLIM